MAAKTEGLIGRLDLEAENPDFPWAGATKSGVALFLLRHGQYHLGELDALLNEQERGKARDHFADSVAETNGAGAPRPRGPWEPVTPPRVPRASLRPWQGPRP